MEILMALRLKEIRPIELQKELYPKFKSAQKWPLLTEEVFRTQLNRKLKKLTKEEEVIRTPKEHQDVRYSISPKGDKRILASDMASLIMMDKDSLNVFGNRIKEMRSEGKMPECFYNKENFACMNCRSGAYPGESSTVTHQNWKPFKGTSERECRKIRLIVPNKVSSDAK